MAAFFDNVVLLIAQISFVEQHTLYVPLKINFYKQFSLFASILSLKMIMLKIQITGKNIHK